MIVSRHLGAMVAPWLVAILALAGTLPMSASASIEFEPDRNAQQLSLQAVGSVVDYMKVSDMPAAVASGPTSDSIPSNVTVSADRTTISNAEGFSIVLTPGSGLEANSAALDAFDRAAARWVTAITSPITVQINADLQNLNSTSILGETSSEVYRDGYDAIQQALVAHGASQGAKDDIITHLPTSSQFTADLPPGFTLSGYVDATTANFKALGIDLGRPANASDATIIFNSQFPFAYSNASGVPSNQFDFESIAAHEIGHALGFMSSVDTVDFDRHNGTFEPIDPTTLDLYRFASTNVPTNSSDFTTKSRSLNSGVEAVTSDVTNSYAMSTGQDTGDGFQASHWKHQSATQPYVGVMDPAIAPGTINENTAADYRSMELMGYDTIAVPEPASLVSLALGLIVGGRVLRRRKLAAA